MDRSFHFERPLAPVGIQLIDVGKSKEQSFEKHTMKTVVHHVYEVPLPPNILYSEFQCLGRILAFFSFLARYFAFSIEISRVFKLYDFRFVLSSDFQSFLTHLRFFIFLLITSD